MWLGFILGGITIICVVVYGVLEYFGFLFVDNIDIPEAMSSILKVSYLCFGGSVIAFCTYFHLNKMYNK